jgi:hypothetical protein
VTRNTLPQNATLSAGQVAPVEALVAGKAVTEADGACRGGDCDAPAARARTRTVLARSLGMAGFGRFWPLFGWSERFGQFGLVVGRATARPRANAC